MLPDGEEPPLLILLQRCAEGRRSWNSLIARTTIPLDGSYSLHIRRKDLTGAGFQTLMSLAGERRDYGDPAALKGRVVTTDDRAFTKLVLGDLELRNALTARPGGGTRAQVAFPLSSDKAIPPELELHSDEGEAIRAARFASRAAQEILLLRRY